MDAKLEFFFYLSHRLSSLFPCDFIIKYDDDQWLLDNTIHQKLLDIVKCKNIIIDLRGFSIKRIFKRYTHKFMKKIDKNILDHVAT